MERITDYMIEYSSTTSGLAKCVSQAIADGWEPYGNFVIDSSRTTNTYYQPLVKKEKASE